MKIIRTPSPRNISQVQTQVTGGRRPLGSGVTFKHSSAIFVLCVLLLLAFSLSSPSTTGLMRLQTSSAQKSTPRPSSASTIHPSAPPPFAPAGIYVTNAGNNIIVRANLDLTGGTSLGNLGCVLNQPTGIALDVAGGKAYITNKVQTQSSAPTSMARDARRSLLVAARRCWTV